MVETGTRSKAKGHLLRFVGSGGCRLFRSPDGQRLLRSDGSEMSIAADVIDDCRRGGLVRLESDRLTLTTEAKSWLRRLVAAREEAHLDQHRTVEMATLQQGGRTETVRINATVSPLAALSRLKDRTGAAWLSPDAVEAGERLARDFHFAALQPRLTQSYEPRTGERAHPGPGAASDLKDSVAAARRRIARAVAAMGPELAGVALDICCFEKGLETVERERLWPPRSAKLMLKTALLALARHYSPPAPSRRRHAWGADGYRPDIVD